MTGKTVVVTGVTSGIGRETAVDLARRGARIVCVARPGEKAERSRDEIGRRSGGVVELVTGDLALMSETRRVAEELLRICPRLDVLVNNAAVGRSSTRSSTKEGVDLTLAVNHVSPFLLTNMLLDRMKDGGSARIVNVASVAHRRFVPDRNDIWGKRTPARLLYRQSKLYMIMFTYELARRLAGTGVTANACCPGGVSTGIWRNFRGPIGFWERMAFLVFLKSAGSGAQVPIRLASSPEISGVTGRYFEVRSHLRGIPYSPEKTEVASSAVSYDEEFQRLLWDETARLTGV